MAHGDYNCCAVCDCKMEYSNEAMTKEDICSSCAVELARRGVFAHSVGELLEWMKTAPPADVIRVLGECGFRECCYPNGVDCAYRAAQSAKKGAANER